MKHGICGADHRRPPVRHSQFFFFLFYFIYFCYYSISQSQFTIKQPIPFQQPKKKKLCFYTREVVDIQQQKKMLKKKLLLIPWYLFIHTKTTLCDARCVSEQPKRKRKHVIILSLVFLFFLCFYNLLLHFLILNGK